MNALRFSVLLGVGMLAPGAGAGSAAAPVQHVIEAAALSVTSTTPTEGEAVTFRFKVANTGKTVATQIPWVLQIDGRVISNGNVQRLAPGETAESSKAWRAECGAHTASFIVDPAGVGLANGASQDRRMKQLSLNVAARTTDHVEPQLPGTRKNSPAS